MSVMFFVSLVNAQSASPKSDAPPAMPTGPEDAIPSSSGMVTKPPATGTESKTIKVPPKQLDPAITKPTEQIDRQNQQKSREKLETK